MKTFYTISVAIIFFTAQASAQYTQNFDGANSLITGCTVVNNVNLTTNSGEVISGTGSMYSSSSFISNYCTPYLNVSCPTNAIATTTTISVSFKYKLNQELTGETTRIIQIGLRSQTGYKPLAVVSMNKDNDPITPAIFNGSFIVPTGVYRLSLKISGFDGSGTERVIIDDVVTSANAYYSLNGTCNSAPVIANDLYFTSNTGSTVNFASVLINDSDPNEERFSAPTVTTPSPDGTVTFNSDGSFSFTPQAGFNGISTTFTYTVFDKGYDPASGTATVTLYFTVASVLPVKLVNFSGTLVDNKPFLSWSVANNDEGALIEIEKSNDGKTFSTASVMMPTTKQGDEKYEYKEGTKLETTSYYRLRITNKNNAVIYSAVVMLSAGKAAVAAETIKLFENPVRNSLRFNYSSGANSNGSVNVYDVTGKKLLTQPVTLRKGQNSIALSLDNKIANGTYLVEIVTSTERAVARFIK